METSKNDQDTNKMDNKPEENQEEVAVIIHRKEQVQPNEVRKVTKVDIMDENENGQSEIPKKEQEDVQQAVKEKVQDNKTKKLKTLKQKLKKNKKRKR